MSDNAKLNRLTYEERQKIETLIKTPVSLTVLASMIGRSKNCVVLEVRRNGGRSEYTAKKGQASADARVDQRKQVLIKNNTGKIGKNPRSHFIHRMRSIEMQVQIISETLKELLNAKNQ